jgi:hypothetical protein
VAQDLFYKVLRRLDEGEHCVLGFDTKFHRFFICHGSNESVAVRSIATSIVVTFLI